MNTKILVTMLVAVIAIGGVSNAAAIFDASNPWTGTVKWSIPSDTSFTIAFALEETQVDFTATSKTENLIEPDSQSDGTPIITITNTGNQNLNFTCHLNTTKPSWATIKVSNTSTHSDATEFDTVKVIVNATVPAAGTTPLYLWTNITDAVAGDTSKFLQINSEV